MKARNTKTGELVTHFGISKEFGTISYVDSKGVLRICAPHDGEWEIIEEPISTLREQTISKACEWLNKNMVEYHPRKGELRPIVNTNAFREAMEKEDEQ